MARYGLAAIFLGAGLEGETVVIAGGLLAHQGTVPLAGAIAAAATGSFAADQLFFLAGRRWRDHALVRRVTARPAFARALAAFERHPAGFIVAFRFLYGLRTISPIAIGTTQVPARRFVLLNAAAAVIWGALFTTLGYLFGHGIEGLFGRLRPGGHTLLLVAGGVLAAAAVVQIVRWRRGR